MTEKEPKYTTGDTADECEPVLTLPPPVAAWPLTGDGHAIISGLLADRAERDALLLATHALEADLAACRAELVAATERIAELEPPPSPYHQSGVRWVSADLYGARHEHIAALEADLQACRAELATAQQALAGWAAQAAVRTGGQRRPPDVRLRDTLQAWRRQVPYAQQAAILAGLMAAEEEKPC